MRAIRNRQVTSDSVRRTEEILVDAHVFRRARPQDLRALAAIAIHQCYDPNELILLLEECEHTIFVVETGWVGVGVTALNGNEYRIRYRLPHQAFRLRRESFYGGVATQAVAMEEGAKLLALPADQVIEIARSSPDLAEDVMNTLMEWADVRDEAVGETAFYTVKGRAARKVLRRAEDDPEGIARGAREELAIAISASRSATSRALNELRNDGVVDFDFTDREHRILILNKKRLAAQK